MPCKLLAWNGKEWSPSTKLDTYARQRTTGPDRLVIGPRIGAIGLLEELSGALPEPFGLLYVLLVSRCGNRPGRYQVPRPLNRVELGEFLREYGPYFEHDGRHHVWLTSLPARATLVYDQHDLIYAYGPLEKYESILETRGMRVGPVDIPAPHQHPFHPIFDDDERRLIARWDWMRFELEPSDDP